MLSIGSRLRGAWLYSDRFEEFQQAGICGTMDFLILKYSQLAREQVGWNRFMCRQRVIRSHTNYEWHLPDSAGHQVRVVLNWKGDEGTI
jgi:hypothetical protein